MCTTGRKHKSSPGEDNKGAVHSGSLKEMCSTAMGQLLLRDCTFISDKKINFFFLQDTSFDGRNSKEITGMSDGKARGRKDGLWDIES